MDDRQLKRTDFNRDEFITKVWNGKRERRRDHRPAAPAGASCDWSNGGSPWTRDSARAVLKIYADLHKRGLLYRDKLVD